MVSTMFIVQYFEERELDLPGGGTQPHLGMSFLPITEKSIKGLRVYRLRVFEIFQRSFREPERNRFLLNWKINRKELGSVTGVSS